MAIRVRLSEAGFTVMEVLVVLTILSILAWAGLPQIVSMQRSISRSNAVSQVEYDLRRARSEALARGARCIFRAAPDGGGYSIGFDYLPFNNPHQMEEVITTTSLPSEITIGLGEDVLFNSRGFVIDDDGNPIDHAVSFYLNGALFAYGTVNPMGGLTMEASE